MSEEITYLIVGNGITGITAAEVLRAEDATATIGVITDDPFPVYYRPALKDYLGGRVGEEKLWARGSSFYQDQRIFLLPDRVVGIEPGQHTLHVQSGKRVAYQKLLLANGAGAARLQCPGNNLQGVTTLRTIADYQAVLARLATVKRVVVSGSGTLALETIETLRHRGVPVTHLVRRQTLWSELLDATASDLVIQQERRDGVDVRLEEEIAEIIGARGAVTGVLTSQGQKIACDLVLVAIGIEPNIGFIRDSRIACWRGVRVDTAMRTNAPDIYAAGDVIETNDTISGRTRVVGQWYPAIQQGRAAAYSMLSVLDAENTFNTNTFYNATFLYGLDFASVGLTTLPTNASGGYQELIAEPKARIYRKVLLKDGVAVGALALGDRKQALALKRAIDHRVRLLPIASRLFADDFQLSAWLDSQGVPPPLLGVKRAQVMNRDARSPRSANGKTATSVGAPPTQKYKSVRKEDIIEKQQRLDNAEEVDETMNRSQPSAGSTEAFLVHRVDPGSSLRVAETTLSQTQVMTVGRQAGVHILIDEPSVSRYHAEIRSTDGTYLLRDLGSSNGTFVNGTRLDPSRTYALKHNDEVRFGRSATFTFLLRTLRQSAQQRLTERDGEPQTHRATAQLQYEVAPNREYAVQGQTVLNSDGTLSTPGTTNPVPADIVALLKNGPALIVLPDGTTKGGERTPQVHLLKTGKHTTIGREEGNDILLPDIVVSRRHAEVFPGPAGFYIHDLGSSNGVTVNQARIENPYLLSHGDRIKLGSTTLFFVDLRVGRQKTEQMPAIPKQSEPTSKRYTAQAPTTQKFVPPGPPTMDVTVCPRCGVVNTRVARFCAGCSAPL